MTTFGGVTVGARTGVGVGSATRVAADEPGVVLDDWVAVLFGRLAPNQTGNGRGSWRVSRNELKCQEPQHPQEDQ